jgi:lipoprotein Spr
VTANYSERARGLVGTPFRPQGRNELGLDCVGLLLSTYDIPISTVRRNYRLRGDHRGEIECGLRDLFRRVPARHSREGDVMLMIVAVDQFHLGVKTAHGFVHAHAGIGRIVETPGLPDWPVLSHYRKRGR